MAEYTGSGLVVMFDGNALESDFREFSADHEIGTADASAGSDAARTYLTTLEDGTASLGLLLQTDGTAATDPRQLLAIGSEGTLEWGPEGTASGKPRRYVNAIVTSIGENVPYEDVVEVNVEFQFSGQLTNTTYA